VTYRAPKERPLRLWYVSLAFGTPTPTPPIDTVVVKVSAISAWSWAREQGEAIQFAIEWAKKQGQAIPAEYIARAICGDDFAEMESAGPPR
jgi:hypothetical protein